MKKFTKSRFRQYGIFTKLDDEIFYQLSAFENYSYKMIQTTKAIHDTEKELSELKKTFNEYADKRLECIDNLHNLIRQKCFYGVPEDALSEVVALLNEKESERSENL